MRKTLVPLLILFACGLGVAPLGFFDGAKGDSQARAAVVEPDLPHGCIPIAQAPNVDFDQFTYFRGMTWNCGSPNYYDNTFHYSAKIIDAQTGQIWQTNNGTAVGDHDFSGQFDFVWCIKANGTGRFIYSHLWIGRGSLSKSSASVVVQCKRHGGGTSP